MHKKLWRTVITSLFLVFLLPIFIVDPASAQDTINYTYDTIGRLKTVTYASGVVIEYTYDLAGNRTSRIVSGANDLPVGDAIPTLGVGESLVVLDNWPAGNVTAPAGGASIAGWISGSSWYNETRWKNMTGPGQSGTIVSMKAGQTEADSNGGGAYSNYFAIDATKAYEFTLYFKKYDLDLQNLYFGTEGNSVRWATGSGGVNTNPYFLAWSLAAQSAVLDKTKWYKVVGYVLPEGYPLPLVNQADWGGVYDVETGLKVADTSVFRWNADRPNNDIYSRFFTYYSQSVQNTFTTYFYRPEVRVTSVSYTPVVPTMTITHVNATEGGNITYTVNLSAATTVDVRVDYAFSGGTGDPAEGTDYTDIPGTLTIAEGLTSGTITVSTTPDTTYEADESIKLTLANPVRATIGEVSEDALIINDDEKPTFTISSPTVTEGGNLGFVVTLSPASVSTQTVAYSITKAAATEAADYSVSPISGTLTFTAGQPTHTVTIATVNDIIDEPQEQVYVTLTSPSIGAKLSGNVASLMGTGKINDNDAVPVFTINSPAGVAEGTSTGGNSTLNFTITSSRPSEFNPTIAYTTASGSALEGTDFIDKTGTATFSGLSTTKNIPVTTKFDVGIEGSETFTMTLSNPVNGSRGTPYIGTGTLTDPTYIHLTDSTGGIYSYANPGYNSDMDFGYNYKLGAIQYYWLKLASGGNTVFSARETDLSGFMTTYLDTGYVSTGQFGVKVESAYFAGGSGSTGNVVPVANNDSITTAYQTAYTFDPRANDSDANGDPLEIVEKTNGTNGSVAINAAGTQVTYTPNAGFSGADSFTYTITDWKSGNATATVSVTVQALNTPPVAVNDSASAAVDVVQYIYVLNNDSDADGDTLTITSVGAPQDADVWIVGGTHLGFSSFISGTEAFTYTISDGKGGTDTATVTVSVAGGLCVSKPWLCEPGIE